ncbi:MAG: LexA family protein [Armatimonadota bacterium]
MHNQITSRQKQILHYIVQHIEMRGYPPTIREIGEAVNLRSTSTVHAHLCNLEDAGLIKRDAGLTRAIRPLLENIQNRSWFIGLGLSQKDIA